MKKSFFQFPILFLALSILLGPMAHASADDLPSVSAFSTSAHSFFLMDADSGDELLKSNPDQALPMASTTKMMTAIIAIEKCALSDVVTIPKDAVGVEGSSIYLIAEEKLTLEELLFGLMLESANDAAVAIAIHTSGSIEAFSDLMNEKAAEIGMAGSHFCNPHGLQTEGHFSTARDLCLLMRYCMKSEAFRMFTGTQTKNISAPGEKTRYLSNHNKLLRLYDGCIGGKTGYTKTAGRCLVSVAERNGKELICATLGDPNDWKDHIQLFDYGFSLYSERNILEKGALSFSVPIIGGQREEVRVFNEEEFSLFLREEESVELSVELPRFCYAGVSEGQCIGEAVYSKNGEEIKRIPLCCDSNVDKKEEKLSFFKKIWQTICLWIS